MKILQAHNFYRVRGGEDVVVEREAALLERSGQRLEKFYEYSSEHSSIFQKVLTAFQLNGTSETKKRFIAIAGSIRPDLLHVHNFFPYLSPSIFKWAKERAIPTVLTLHNFRLFCANGLMLRNEKSCDLCLSEPGVHAVRFGCYQNSKIQTIPVANMIRSAMVERTWWEYVDHFIVSTQFTKNVYVRFGLPADKISVKVNFCPKPLRSAALERENFTLYAGRLSEEKGIKTLVSSWRPEFGELKFCGSGPLSDWIRSKGFRVLESRSQTDLLNEMAKARALILPTECFETGIPLIAMEAASLGTPMILSRFGACEEYFQDEKNALLFSPGNILELQGCWRRILDDAPLRNRLGLGAKQVYEMNFSEDGQVEQLMKIYLHVTKRNL